MDEHERGADGWVGGWAMDEWTEVGEVNENECMYD